MAKRRKGDGMSNDLPDPRRPQLPKNALERINLGQSFAEYDRVLKDPGIFVETPAFLAAKDPDRSRCFFVGRRGTGKTAITEIISARQRGVLVIHPEIFTITESYLPDDLGDSHQKPFRSLIGAFRRAIEQQILSLYLNLHPAERAELPPELYRDLAAQASTDFDERSSILIAEMFDALDDDRRWRGLRSKAKSMSAQMKDLVAEPKHPFTLIFDRVDENWDGTDAAVIHLSALMHACLQVNGDLNWARVLIFLRENVFERVRSIDTEFARLETAVVGLDWTEEQLTEMIERRLNLPFNTRIKLGGETWAAYFEDADASRRTIFDYCQRRPRDVLTYCTLALETAVGKKHQRILLEDLSDAQRRFSDSRLKDLGDEYAENFPQIGLVLGKFYGLTQRFLLPALEVFLRALHEDQEVQKACASWVYQVQTPEQLARLLYNIGFVGFGSGDNVQYRSLGPQDTTPPPLSEKVDITIHPSFHPALDLQDRLMTGSEQRIEFPRIGVVADLPGSLSRAEYFDALDALSSDLSKLSLGHDDSDDFEDILKRVVELCFFRSLSNVVMRSRDADGTVIRDVVAANHSHTGFWGVVREKFGAVQVVWEAKNYKKLKADDYHQVSYYMTDLGGKFAVLVYRGDEALPPTYISHLKRMVADSKGFVLLLTERDLNVFIRQSRHGKIKDDHIQARFDAALRQVT